MEHPSSFIKRLSKLATSPILGQGRKKPASNVPLGSPLMNIRFARSRDLSEDEDEKVTVYSSFSSLTTMETNDTSPRNKKKQADDGSMSFIEFLQNNSTEYETDEDDELLVFSPESKSKRQLKPVKSKERIIISTPQQQQGFSARHLKTLNRSQQVVFEKESVTEDMLRLLSLLKSRKFRNELIGMLLPLQTDFTTKVRFISSVDELLHISENEQKTMKAGRLIKLFLEKDSLFNLCIPTK